MKYQVVEGKMTPSEYCQLREKTGLSKMDLSAASEALPNSLYTIAIRDQERLIAMGRVIGDGGCFAQVVDIAVDPDYQKQGLSRIIMESIMKFIESQIPKCAVVSLFADVDFLYEKFGFYHPISSKGMFLRKT